MTRKRANGSVLAAERAWRRTWGLRTLRRYAGQYVALLGRRVVAHAPSMDELYRLLDRASIRGALIERIEEPVAVVY